MTKLILIDGLFYKIDRGGQTSTEELNVDIIPVDAKLKPIKEVEDEIIILEKDEIFDITLEVPVAFFYELPEGKYILLIEEKYNVASEDYGTIVDVDSNLKLKMIYEDGKVKFDLLEWNFIEGRAINNFVDIEYNVKNNNFYYYSSGNFELEGEEAREEILSKFKWDIADPHKEYNIDDAKYVFNNIYLNCYEKLIQLKTINKTINKTNENKTDNVVKVNINQSKKDNDNDLDNR